MVRRARAPRLLSAHPAIVQTEMIQLGGPRDDRRIARDFAAAGRRLAASHTGEPSDDEILLPMLYLYRHAIELALKEAILEATHLRRIRGEDDPQLTYKATKERLQDECGHKIAGLRDELNLQLHLLSLQPIRPDVAKHLEWINLLDWNGSELRYTNQSSYWQGDIDLPGLVSTLKEIEPHISAVYDTIEHEIEAYEEWQEAERDFGGY
jgi:hypothetical protein